MEKIVAALISCLTPDSGVLVQIAVEQSCKVERLQTVGKGKRELKLTVTCKCEP